MNTHTPTTKYWIFDKVKIFEMFVRADLKIFIGFLYSDHRYIGRGSRSGSSLIWHHNGYEALHCLDYNSDPKETISQGHCSNKLDIKLSFVYYIIMS